MFVLCSSTTRAIRGSAGLPRGGIMKSGGCRWYTASPPLFSFPRIWIGGWSRPGLRSRLSSRRHVRWSRSVSANHEGRCLFRRPLKHRGREDLQSMAGSSPLDLCARLLRESSLGPRSLGKCKRFLRLEWARGERRDTLHVPCRSFQAHQSRVSYKVERFR
jgi:hypothetical protein